MRGRRRDSSSRPECEDCARRLPRGVGLKTERRANPTSFELQRSVFELSESQNIYYPINIIMYNYFQHCEQQLRRSQEEAEPVREERLRAQHERTRTALSVEFKQVSQEGYQNRVK